MPTQCHYPRGVQLAGSQKSKKLRQILTSLRLLAADDNCENNLSITHVTGYRKQGRFQDHCTKEPLGMDHLACCQPLLDKDQRGNFSACSSLGRGEFLPTIRTFGTML